MSVWVETPYLNLVYDEIKKLTKDGEVPISEKEIISSLSRQGYDISPSDLVKLLIKMEIMGLIVVSSSTKEERLIKLNKTERHEEFVQVDNES
ncbi:hypothetical protein Calag_1411 [Caldisphaera lagunensis DSM 15908]|uniref:Uncharacterized protein n=1 Tax=Caldisphaera lagunensis (strain DSM 15908 / JCM 11604 / ANMR 0165 / IC-154) TaxID=1056495 RepID=L0AB51_CALLD|nr:hypothetical protein [Caldisphaera lagunensis]AFZ71118.1 hypothetical protein Calag_1411 [Caldisphaera lagunensis DSM 15908]